MKAWKLGLGLLLSLLLLACLLPAAYADGLTDALDSFNRTGSPTGYTLNEAFGSRESDFTVPGGFTLTVGDGGRLVCDNLTIASEGRVLLSSGSLTSWADAITLDGELKLQRGMLSCGAGSFDALKAAQKAGRLTFNGDEWRIGTFDAVYDEAAVPAAIDRAKDIMAYFGDYNAAATVQTWCDWTIPAGSTVDVGSATVEIDRKLTVQGALTARQFNMHPSSHLVVDGGTVTVMGAEGMFQPFNTGGSITLRNGGEIYTAFGSFAGSNGRGLRDAANTNKLIFEDADSHVNFSYMVYISDFLDLDDLLSGTHEIYNTLRREHTSVSMRLMDDWTVGAEYSGENYLELNQIAVEVKAGKTLTVNGELHTKSLTADTGSLVVVEGSVEEPAHLHVPNLVPNGSFTLRNGDISTDAENLEAFAAAEKAGRVSYEGYALLKPQYEVFDGAEVADAILAGTNACLIDGQPNPTRAFDVDVRDCDWTVNGTVTVPGFGYLALKNSSVTVPQGAKLIAEGDLNIAEDASLTVNGTLVAREDGWVMVHGSLYNNNAISLTSFDRNTGTLLIDAENGGRYEGAEDSRIMVQSSLDFADEHILGINLNQFSRQELQDNGRTVVLYTRNPALFTGFKSYCEGNGEMPDLTGIDVLTLTDSVTVITGREADVSGLKLVVPVGVTLTVNGSLTVGEFDIQQNAGNRGAIVIGDTGTMTLTKWQALSNNIWDGWQADYKAGRLVFRDKNAGFTLMRGGLSSLDDLKTAIDNAAAYIDEGKDHILFSALTVGGSEIDASAEKLNIPIGMTLTLNGKLTVGDFGIVQNFQSGMRGDVAIGEGGELHVTKWLDLSNNLWTIWQQRGETGGITFDNDAGFILQRGFCATDVEVLAFTLRDARQTISGNPHLKFAFGIPDISEIDATGLRLSIPNGVILNVSGKLTVRDFDLEIDFQTGSWGKIQVVDNGELHLTAWKELYDMVWFTWMQDGSSDGRITFDDDAGFIINRNVGSKGDDWDGLARAMEDGGNYLKGHSNLIFNIFVSEDTFIDGRDTAYTLPAGAVLHVDGTLLTGSFTDNGSVNVGENGFLYAQDLFRIGENVTQGMFNLDGTLSVEHTALIPEQLEVVTPGENSLIDVSFNCYSTADILAELNNPTAFFPHFQRSVWVICDWVLEEDLELPGQIRLCVANDGDHHGSLTVPAEVRLTVPANTGIYAREGVPFVVNGALVNDGWINLGEPSRMTDITLGPKGVYAGGGTLIRGDASYELRNDPSHADLILPASLTQLRSEALAGGGFRTVYIPATAEKPIAVAPDAFGDAEDLIVLGRPGSSAESFAESKGFPFAPVP